MIFFSFFQRPRPVLTRNKMSLRRSSFSLKVEEKKVCDRSARQSGLCSSRCLGWCWSNPRRLRECQSPSKYFACTLLYLNSVLKWEESWLLFFFCLFISSFHCRCAQFHLLLGCRLRQISRRFLSLSFPKWGWQPITKQVRWSCASAPPGKGEASSEPSGLKNGETLCMNSECAGAD